MKIKLYPHLGKPLPLRVQVRVLLHYKRNALVNWWEHTLAAWILADLRHIMRKPIPLSRRLRELRAQWKMHWENHFDPPF